MSMKNQLLIAALIFVALAVLIDQLSATEYPTPPPVPQAFHTANDVQRYLNQLHNYYMVVGRPRFGKRGGNPVNFGESSLPFLKNQVQYKPDEDSKSSSSSLSSSSSSASSSYVNQMFQFLDLNGDNSISLGEFKRIFNKDTNSE